MIGILAALLSMTAFGLAAPFNKMAFSGAGRHRTIVYTYLVLVPSIFLVAILSGQRIWFPAQLLHAYLLQCIMGAIGVIAAFKALEMGRTGVISTLGRGYTLIVLLAGIILLGESLSLQQMAGALLVVASSFVIGAGTPGRIRLESGLLFVAISIIGRAYYYTGIKMFVEALGPMLSVALLELGVCSMVVAYYLVRRRDLSLPGAGARMPIAAGGASLLLATVAYNVSVAELGAGLTSAIIAGGPIITAIASHFMLGERLEAEKYAAIVLMALGLVAIFI